MINEFSRTELLIGSDNLQKLKQSKVIVFGVGGVGSYVVEALARGGIGNLTIVDNDTVSVTNINRQLPAVHSTIGKLKTEVVKQHILDINPNCNVNALNLFYNSDTCDTINLLNYDYIVDAIDTVSSKLLLVEKANEHNIPIICSMGTGNKLDPTRFKITDIYKTSMCPLAKVMRYELKKRGIKKLKVLFSDEQPCKPYETNDKENTSKRQVPASISFVPSVAGLIIGGEVIKSLIK